MQKHFLFLTKRDNPYLAVSEKYLNGSLKTGFAFIVEISTYLPVALNAASTILGKPVMPKYFGEVPFTSI